MNVFGDDDSDDNFLENDIEILDIVDFGYPRKIYVRSNHFEDLDNLTFLQRFRLTKDTVMNVLPQIEYLLEYPLDINNSISPINQLLTCLRFYATGGHLSSIADFMGIHTATASRVIERVSAALAGLGHTYIKMPPRNDLRNVQNSFYEIASFPRIIGCVDGTHVKIQSPGGEDPEVFRNRKTYFSINVQVVGDSNLKIQDIVARWPGSSHDMTVYTHSRIRARLENGEFENGIILGDSGYALSPYLLTPLQNPNTPSEQLYNEAHIRTRNTIERLFGVWKRRFPVLAYGIRVKLESALTIIIATAVLHNIASIMHEDEPPLPPEVNAEDFNNLLNEGNIIEENNENVNVANITRNDMIRYFNNLL